MLWKSLVCFISDLRGFFGDPFCRCIVEMDVGSMIRLKVRSSILSSRMLRARLQKQLCLAFHDQMKSNEQKDATAINRRKETGRFF